MTKTRELDFIIFGASGFTGKYTIYESVKLLDGYKWGVAGRNRTKLEETLKEIGKKAKLDLSHTPIIIADVTNPESLKQMAERCKVVINCTGPYCLWGEPVVKACIEAGTHQVDVTGEAPYMERMEVKYNELAKKTGSYIVSACGFDCIPADLGVIFLESQFEGTVNSVEQYVTLDLPKTRGAQLHFGTWATNVHVVGSMSLLKEMQKKDPLANFKPRLQARSVVHKLKPLKQWCVPFLGADPEIVLRTQQTLYEAEKKRPIQIKSYVAIGCWLQTIFMVFAGIIFGIIASFSCGQRLLLAHPKFFSFGLASHEGPTEETMEKQKFAMHLFGKGWSWKLSEPTEEPKQPPNKEIHVVVGGTNPGYGFTCVALILSAVTLLKEEAKLPGTGGVLTPGTVFAKTNLIDELCKNGATFEVVHTQEEVSKKN